jgi:sporulation integral membrane protein YtvI
MDTEYKKAANITVIVAGIAAALWLLFKYALGALAPFLLAAALAALISPLARTVSKRTKIPHKPLCAILLIAIFSILAALSYLAISRLLFELGSLLGRLSENPEIISQTLEKFASAFTRDEGGLGAIGKIFQSEAFVNLGIDVNELLRSALESLISALTSALPSAAVGIVAKIPSVILFTVVFLISAFYFASDGQRIWGALFSLLPSSWQRKLPALKQKFSTTVSGYIKAYLLIMLMTFLEAFVGLSILRVNYAFIIAIIIAIVDVLPILGTGTVLIPWALFAFFSSDIRLGVGLLVLYGVTLIVRQLVEPKIVGSTLGIHPLLTLASVYIGLELIGFVGIFAGPMVALFVKETVGEDKKSNYSNHSQKSES